MQSTELTVRQLNYYVKSLLDGDSRLSGITVTGEISNLKNHYASGHIYFTLKDEDAAVRCVMFRTNAARISFTPSDGMKVSVKGRASLYEKDGQYQFYAEEMTEAGSGALAMQFALIKEKLEKEGLFDTSTKRPLPHFPKKIAVITSESGAALRDIVSIISRRWQSAQIVIFPASVQGDAAVPEMLRSLEAAYGTDGIDVGIIGRGGGSAEDLWAFNSEELARKIYESPFPMISAVGHETDFSISDFAADVRAATPSAAAELAVPDKAEISALLSKQELILKNSLLHKFENSKLRFIACSNSPFFKNPDEALVCRRAEYTDRLYDRLKTAQTAVLERDEIKTAQLAARLDALSPLKVMARGYAAVRKNGKNICKAAEICVNDIINIDFADGSAECEVKNITGSESYGK